MNRMAAVAEKETRTDLDSLAEEAQRQYWTENDPSMKMTQSGKDYEELMMSTKHKHSKRTYARLIE